MASQNKYFLLSFFAHLLLFFFFVFSLQTLAPLPVFENTNHQDVISAVVLGDEAQSKILAPQHQTLPEPVPQTTNKVIPLEKKKTPDQLQKKVAVANLKKQFLADNLLKEIHQQKKIKQQQLQKKFKKTLQQMSEKTLRENLLNEEIKLNAVVARQAQGEVNKYKALILQAISENWLVPPQADKKKTCALMIRLAENGTVLDVQITKSSGDVALDHSARAAIFKASPLPVPKDRQAFQVFKQFVLKVKPENVL